MGADQIIGNNGYLRLTAKGQIVDLFPPPPVLVLSVLAYIFFILYFDDRRVSSIWDVLGGRMNKGEIGVDIGLLPTITS